MKLMDDPESRRTVARHIRFEVHALWATAIEYTYRSRGVCGSDVIIDNALIESCLVHARLLADFLDAKKATYEDALAVHYAPSWHSRDTLTKDERDLINWMIMHLSAERIRVTEGLDLVKIAERVLQVMGQFIAQIIEPEIQRWFEPVVRELATFARRYQEMEERRKANA
jgi:hypothetical protein